MHEMAKQCESLTILCFCILGTIHTHLKNFATAIDLSWHASSELSYHYQECKRTESFMLIPSASENLSNKFTRVSNFLKITRRIAKMAGVTLKSLSHAWAAGTFEYMFLLVNFFDVDAKKELISVGKSVLNVHIHQVYGRIQHTILLLYGVLYFIVHLVNGWGVKYKIVQMGNFDSKLMIVYALTVFFFYHVQSCT